MPVRSSLNNTCPVLVGREREMDALVGALSTGGLVLVEGEAGIGKSRLLRGFADRAEQEGHAVAWGRAESVSRPGPFSLLLDLVENIASGGGASTEARDLAESLLTLRTGQEPPARQVAARVRGALARLGRAPVVIFEDLHFADELSLAVLAHLARSASDDGATLVATFRPEAATQGALARMLDVVIRDRTAADIQLQPLAPDEVASMLEAMWGAPPSDDELGRVARLAEGIPFFVEELGAASEGSIPPSIARAVASRLDRIDEAGKQIIRAAALMTSTIDPGVLAEVCGRSDGEVASTLVAAARAGLLTDAGGFLVFRHALVREAIAGDVVSIERAEMHGRIARALEGRAGDQLEAHAAALARHWTEAGDGERGAVYWVRAGHRSLAAGALDEARAAFASAVACEPSEEVELRALTGDAEVSIRVRAFDDAQTRFRQLADRHVAAGRKEDAAECLSRLAWLRLVALDRAGIGILEEALGLLDGADDDARYGRLLIEKGVALARFFNDADAGEEPLREGLRRADGLGDAALRSRAHEGLAWVAETRGDVARADREGGEAFLLARETEDDELITRSATDHAVRLTLHGKASDALSVLEDVRPRLVAGIASLYAQSVDHLRAWVLWRMGMPARADEAAARLEATRFAGAYGRVVRTWAAVERGEERAARQVLDAWWAELGGVEHRARMLANPEEAPDPESYAILGELVLAVEGGVAVAPDTVRLVAAYEETVKDAVADVRWLVGLLYARALIRSGEAADAEQILDAFDAFAAATPYPWHQALATELRGHIADLEGQKKEAAGLFREAAEAFEVCSNASARARCLRLASSSAGGDGVDKEAVIEQLKVGRTLAAEAGAVAEANRIESVMRSLGIRPRAGRPKGSGRPQGALSPREQEVAALVASGASNADIARRLFLSERTVQDHIAHALRRLSLAGRASLAAWAAKQGLV